MKLIQGPRRGYFLFLFIIGVIVLSPVPFLCGINYPVTNYMGLASTTLILMLGTINCLYRSHKAFVQGNKITSTLLICCALSAIFGWKPLIYTVYTVPDMEEILYSPFVSFMGIMLLITLAIGNISLLASLLFWKKVYVAYRRLARERELYEKGMDSHNENGAL